MISKTKVEYTLTEFGKTVKKKLIDRDMTLIELAEELNISNSYLSHILYGRSFTIEVVNKICEILDIELEKNNV